MFTQEKQHIECGRGDFITFHPGADGTSVSLGPQVGWCGRPDVQMRPIRLDLRKSAPSVRERTLADTFEQVGFADDGVGVFVEHARGVFTGMGFDAGAGQDVVLEGVDLAGLVVG